MLCKDEKPLIINLYIIRLKPLDIQFMKQLHNKVNIVPVLAKADTLTKNEVAKLKRKVSFILRFLNKISLSHADCKDEID